MRRVLLWLPPLAYMALIFYLSSESQPMPEVTAHVWDKLLHVVEYGVLAALLCRALREEGFGWRAAFIAAALAASAYGASDEWHQAFVPLRESSVRDWFADLLGGAVGAAVYGVVRSFLIRFDVSRVDLDADGLSNQID